MSQLKHAIRSYCSGTTSRDELLSLVDQELLDRRASPQALLDILAEDTSAPTLPAELQRAVMTRITNWSDDTQLLRDATPSVTPPPLDLGTVLQCRFKLVELIGQGGMSCVYKAIDQRRVEARSQNPFLALKVLTLPFDDYADSIQALDREAHKLQSLTHPNIVRVFDVDRDGETVFMTMEYLSGESLRLKVPKAAATSPPPMTAEAAARIVVDIAKALECAHSAGIVHGDLKPGNVIITDSGEVKVIDFGIARFFGRAREGAGSDTLSDTLNALTPRYASPERLEGDEPDPRDDIYALACIAYETLSGHHPFSHASSIEVRTADTEVAPHPAISPQQLRAIKRGLQFDRNLRTPTVHAFIEDFVGKRPDRSRWLLMAGATAIVVVGLAAYLSREPRTPPLAAGQVFRDCPTCPLMTVVPAGTFKQGSAADASEQPVRQVTIGAPIAIASREVTVGEFEEFAADVSLRPQGCNVYDGDWRLREHVSWNSVEGAQTALHPVTCVSWADAVAYTIWLSKKTHQVYRLPSASEWEYAASAGATPGTLLSDDTASVCERANVSDQAAAQRYPGWAVVDCNDRYPQSAPVGSFSANAFGLQDMIGNVFEWVQDCWNPTYDGALTNGTAQLADPCTLREMRGGSWFTSPEYLRASYRNHFEPDYRSSSVGFRVAREIPR